MRLKPFVAMLGVTGALVAGGAALANAESTSSKSRSTPHARAHKSAPARPRGEFGPRFRHDLRRAFGPGGMHHCPGMGGGSGSAYAPGPPPQAGV